MTAELLVFVIKFIQSKAVAGKVVRWVLVICAVQIVCTFLF